MAENTLQYEWIVTLKTNLEHLLREDPHVFIAADLLWYPVEGRPDIRRAPDVMVAFGRPKGFRGSYQQWLEEGIAPQVVIEVLSPGNRPMEMHRKLRFYEEYGVEEYCMIEPDPNDLGVAAYQREHDKLVAVPIDTHWQSPRLGIRVGIEAQELVARDAEGNRFRNPEDIQKSEAELKLVTKQQAQEIDQLKTNMQQQAEELAKLRAELERLKRGD